MGWGGVSCHIAFFLSNFRCKISSASGESLIAYTFFFTSPITKNTIYTYLITTFILNKVPGKINVKIRKSNKGGIMVEFCCKRGIRQVFLTKDSRRLNIYKAMTVMPS